MKNKECFVIEGETLYFEHALISFENIPVYFICKSKKHYYIALCIDFDNYNYYVVKTSNIRLYDVLHGLISLRNAIIKNDCIYEVVSGEDIKYDKVVKINVCDIDESVLPIEGATYDILGSMSKKYVEEFDEKILSDNNFKEMHNKYESEIKTELFCNYINASDFEDKGLNLDFTFNNKYDSVNVNGLSNLLYTNDCLAA